MGGAVRITRLDLTAKDLRAAAAREKDGSAARRMLALALVLDGVDRKSAAESCGMDRQTLRDWVHRYNAEGLGGLHDLKTPGPKPKLTAEQQGELAKLVEAGPDPARHGVVRWRRVDLRDELERRFGVALHERSVGKVLAKLGYRRLSVRPRHPQTDEAAQEAFKKTSPQWSRHGCPTTPKTSPSKSGSRCYGDGLSRYFGSPNQSDGAATMQPNDTVNPTILLAIELSASTWLIAARVPGSEKPHLHRIDGGDTAALLALISSLRARVARLLDAAIGIVCCFEAGRDGFWLHRLLTAHGVASHVLEPTSILVNRRARRAKTDRLDAEGMLRVLAAYLRGDHQSCSMVRVPTLDEEDAKRTHRERENLVHERLRIENRIEALLFTQGIRKRPSLRSWERDLDVLRTGDGREIPRHLRAELDRLRRRLVITLELIREVEAERDQAAETKPQDQACRKIAALCRIRGIGANFAAVLTREVFYRSFDNRRQIASYVGITPMPYQSGGMDRDRRISRAGNPRARTTMIQLAWLWLRYQPGSELAEWFRERVGTLAGRTRRIAIVAMARKLLIALWRYAETGVIPAGVDIWAETTVAA